MVLLKEIQRVKREKKNIYQSGIKVVFERWVYWITFCYSFYFSIFSGFIFIKLIILWKNFLTKIFYNQENVADILCVCLLSIFPSLQWRMAEILSITIQPLHLEVREHTVKIWYLFQTLALHLMMFMLNFLTSNMKEYSL